MADFLYRVQVGWVAGSRNFGLNVFHYVFDDSSFANEFLAAQALANAFVINVVPLFTACMSPDTIVDLCSARKISIPLPPNVQPGGPSANSVVNQIGTFVGAGVSAALAACVKWINADPDNLMGRSFLGGFPAAAIVDDVWQAPFVSAVLALIGGMTPGLTVGAVHAVLSKYDRKNHTHYPITDGQLNPKPSGFNKRTLPVT